MKILLLVLILKTVFSYNYNPCKYSDNPFIRYNWRNWRLSFSERYQLCTCNGTQVGTCYNRTQYLDYSNPTIKSAIIKACQWSSPDLEGCGSSNWKPSSYYVCPKCSCTDQTKLTWFEQKRKWYSNCYYCDCQSTGTTKCTHFDYIYSHNRQKNTCPPKAMCEDTSVSKYGYVYSYFSKRFLRGDTMKKYGSSNGLNTQFKYCNGSSGQIQVLTFGQIRSSKTLRDILFESNSYYSYTLRPCLTDYSRWTFVSHYPACLCPSDAVSGRDYYIKADERNIFYDSVYNNLKFQYCYRCRCSNSLWSCSSIGGGLAPIECSANLRKCNYIYESNSYKSISNTTCLASSTCQRSSLFSINGDLFSGGITAPTKNTDSGCGQDYLCLVLGADSKCKKAVIDTNAYVYNCTTDKLEQTKVVGEEKMMCCNSDYCNRNFDAYAATDCQENADWSKMEKLKYDILFGEDNKDVVETLGKLECAAKEKGNGGNGLGILFDENSCTEQMVAKFLTSLTKAYCQYLAVGYNKLSSDAKKKSERLFKEFVQIYSALMAKSGCSFNPKCDLSTGRASGTVKTSVIKFTLLVNGTIANTTIWKQFAQEGIGKSNVKDVNQLTVDSKSRRRLSNGLTSYSVSITAMTPDQAQAISNSLQTTNADLGGTITNLQQTGETTSNIGDSSSGVTLSVKFGFFLSLFLFFLR